MRILKESPVTHISIENSQLEKRLRLIKRLFKLTFMIFRSSGDKPKISKPRFIFAVFLLGLNLYQTFHILCASKDTPSDQIIKALITCLWNVQCLAAMFFILYWQLFGHFQKMLCSSSWHNLGHKIPKTLRTRIRVYRMHTVFCLLLLFIVVTSSLMIFSYYVPNKEQYRILSEALFGGFGHYLAVLGILLNAYSQFVWCVVLFFYTGVCARLHEQINGFSRELKDIGHKSKDPEDIANELQLKYDQLTNLSTLVQKADSTFQVYAFLMISTNIPVTVLSLLQFLQFLFKSATDAAYFSINVVICVTELAAITLPAARVYSAIHSIEPNMFANKRIWLPHNDKVYQIGKLLIDHSKQDGLGISIWNFALISKGLILTTASLVFTYLTIIIQMKHPDEQKSL